MWEQPGAPDSRLALFLLSQAHGISGLPAAACFVPGGPPGLGWFRENGGRPLLGRRRLPALNTVFSLSPANSLSLEHLSLFFINHKMEKLKAEIQIPALPLPSCTTLGKFLNLFEPPMFCFVCF